MVEEMKVREGYKKTGVGVIPEDWKVVTIRDAFAFLATGNNSRSDTKEQGTINYIHYGDIHTRWEYFLDCDKSNIPFIDEYKIKNLPKLQDGDLIIADASEDYEGVGKSIEIRNVKKRKVVSGLHTILLRADKRIFADGFKGYIQEFESVRQQLRKIATGISVYGISKKGLRDILIPLPHQKEQKAIATVLTDTDNLIASLEKLIDKKKKIKQGTMQQLLTGKKRLPGFSGEWEVKWLGDIAEIVMGQSPLSQYYNTNNIGLPLVQGNADICNRKTVIRNYTSQITKEAKKNDIIMTVRAPVGYIGRALFDCCIGRGVCSIRYQNDYLYHYLIFIENTWSVLSKGSTFDSVNSKEVNEVNIEIPVTIKEQKAISKILSNMDLEIESLQQKLSKYKIIKQGMMQELLTGRIRLI